MYSFQLTKNIVGIDLGSHSLKIAECQRAGEKVSLINYEIRRWPKPANPNQALSREELSLFIRQTLKDCGIRSTETVSEITGPWTVARHLFLPDLADDELREAIRWGSKADFPFSLEDAVIDFYKIDVFKREEGESEAEIIAAAATREVVEEQASLLKEAGLKPLFLSIPPFDLMQAYRLSQPPPWTETAAVIDLGHRNTRIVVLKEGNLKFSREIAVAGDAFTQSLIGSYDINGIDVDVDESLAERIKIKSGLAVNGEGEIPALVEGIPLDQIQKRLGSVKDRLVLEIERSLTYYLNQFKDYEIKKILLTGGGSLLPGLREVLEKNLELPIEPFQRIGPINLKKKIKAELFHKNVPFMANVLGLISQTKPYVDLSPTLVTPQVRKKTAAKIVKPALAGALLFGLFYIFGWPYWTAIRQVAALQKEVVVKKAQVARVGKAADEMVRMEKEEALLNQALEGIPKIEIPKISMGAVFQELSRLVPSNITLTRFQCSKAQEISTGPDLKGGSPKPEPLGGKTGETQGSGKEERRADYALIIQGIVFGSDQEIIATLSAFAGNLNRSNYFREAKVQMTLKVKDYAKAAAEFKLLARLGEGPRQGPGGAS